MTKIILVLTFLALSVVTLEASVRFAPLPNPGVVEIAHPELFDRVFAISDTHGMYGNLRQLLLAQHIVAFSAEGNAQWAVTRSLLIVVGDSIDKGDDSLDILNLWRQLKEQAPNDGNAVLLLLGNHEAEFLADPTNPKAAVFMKELQQKHVPLEPIVAFLRQMSLAARVGNWLFCHAGLYPAMPWNAFAQQASALLTNGVYGSPFLIGPNSILEAKAWWKDPSQRAELEARLLASPNHFYGVVFGHQPGTFGVRGDIAGIDQLRLIKIDSGMAPKEDDEDGVGSQPGHMLLFKNAKDLNTMVPPEAYSLSAVSIRRLPTE